MILCIRCILQSGDESAEFWTWSQRRSLTIRLHSQLAHTGSPTTLVKHTKWLLLIHKSPLSLFSSFSNFIAFAFFLSRFRHNVMFHLQLCFVCFFSRHVVICNFLYQSDAVQSLFSDAVMFERLLSMIYRSHNVYCIHVDLKARYSYHNVLSF